MVLFLILSSWENLGEEKLINSRRAERGFELTPTWFLTRPLLKSLPGRRTSFMWFLGFSDSVHFASLDILVTLTTEMHQENIALKSLVSANPLLEKNWANRKEFSQSSMVYLLKSLVLNTNENTFPPVAPLGVQLINPQRRLPSLPSCSNKWGFSKTHWLVLDTAFWTWNWTLVGAWGF